MVSAAFGHFIASGTQGRGAVCHLRSSVALNRSMAVRLGTLRRDKNLPNDQLDNGVIGSDSLLEFIEGNDHHAANSEGTLYQYTRSESLIVLTTLNYFILKDWFQTCAEPTD